MNAKELLYIKEYLEEYNQIYYKGEDLNLNKLIRKINELFKDE